MAKAVLNPIFLSIRGTVGDYVLKQYGNRLVISRRPVFKNRVFSKAQKEAHEKFRQATLFAKELMKNPRVREVYQEEARVTRKPILSLMISDYFRASSLIDKDIVRSDENREAGISRTDKQNSPGPGLHAPLGVGSESWFGRSSDDEPHKERFQSAKERAPALQKRIASGKLPDSGLYPNLVVFLS